MVRRSPSSNGISATKPKHAAAREVVARGVLKVGVLDDDDVRARLGHTRANRRALAAVDRVPEESETVRTRRDELLHHRRRLVCRGVDDNDALPGQIEGSCRIRAMISAMVCCSS
jgi:hypothetical protein